MKKNLKVAILVATCGVIVVLVSGVALLGHIVGRDMLWSWKQSLGMALPTSVCLFFVGTALLAIGNSFMPNGD